MKQNAAVKAAAFFLAVRFEADRRGEAIRAGDVSLLYLFVGRRAPQHRSWTNSVD
jgi:hypothetical protein